MIAELCVSAKVYRSAAIAWIVWFSGAGAIGCGGDGADVGESPDAAADAAKSDGAPVDAAGGDSSQDVGGDALAEVSAPDAETCVPQPGPDAPDDAFEDANCDGIDGDAAQAVFVAPSGDDGAAGTLDAPVASLQKAVELAASQSKAIYVCNATYSEPLVLHAAVSVFGGYDCANAWRRTNDRAWAAPPTGSALVIEDVDGAVAIERMGFRSSDAFTAGESSIAARIVRASQVKLIRSAFEAGDGANGEPGAQVSPVTQTAPKGEAGESLPTVTCNKANPTGVCASSGQGGNTMFLGACTQGGYGGVGGNVIVEIAQGAGKPGTPNGAAGGQVGHVGNPGGPGIAGAVGDASQNGIGSLEGDEYVPSNRGGDGGVGKAGQAGGGGSGGSSACIPADCSVAQTFFVGGGGGQGGVGGCGGKGGKGGGGGGASIGLLVLDSAVELVGCSVTTGDGGMGGGPSAGAAGQPGGGGGPGGSGTASGGKGFAGGSGGNGGPGGSGGPGGGGPSVGVLVSGPEPTVSPTTLFDIGVGGDGGKGISAGDAVDGVTAETLLISNP